MKAFTDKLGQFQALIVAILALLTAVGVDKAGLLAVLRNPLDWGTWEPLFLAAVGLIVGVAIVRQTYANASRLKDPNALRLDPAEPRHLLGRKADIARVVGALPRRLVFLVGESGSGKTALLQAGVLAAPELAREFVPVYIDLTDQDWDDGLLMLIRDRFRLALPDGERQGFAGSDSASAADLLAAFDLYRQKLGCRPLLIFDQFDDYAAHHVAHLRDPEIGAWRGAAEVAAENSALKLVRDGLAQRTVAALFASRREDQDALETVRMLPNPSILRLDRPPTGSAGSIIDAVTTAQVPGQVVVENPGATWPALKRRLAADLEQTGQVLPQQLKLVLQGLRSLPRLTVGAYERAGRIDGLEAASMRDAIAASARGSTLSAALILDGILVPLVDAERRPPSKARPRTVAQWDAPGLDPASLTEVLAVLADREIVRCVSDPSDKAAFWQLDHDYLARPILRLKAEQEKWAILLAERGTAFRDAGLSLSRRWRSLLSLWQQIGVLIARLRGRLRYGSATGVALASLATSIMAVATPLTAVGAVGWAAWQYNEAARIEASLGGVQRGGVPLTKDQREALLDLANGNLLTRRLVMHDIFVRPQQATAFSARPAEMLLALTGLDADRTARLVTSHDELKMPDRINPAFRTAWAGLVRVGAASLLVDPRAGGLLDQILVAIQQTTDTDQLNALEQAYKAVADMLPAPDPRARGLIDQVLAASKQTTSPYQLSALAQAYKAVADKLPAADPRASGLLDQILAAIKQTTDTDQLNALAQAYKAVADMLPAADLRAAGLLDQIVAASKQTTSPYRLNALAQAYKAVADKLPAAADPRADGLLDQILAAIKQTTSPYRLNALVQAYKAIADKPPAADPRADGLLDQILAAIKQTSDTDQLNALAQAYKAAADPRAGGLLDQILATIKQTTSPDQLSALVEVYKAIADKLPVADPHAGELLEQILAASKQTTSPYQLTALAQTYKAVADKLPAADPRADGLLDQILAAIKQTTSPDQLSALVEAYKAVANELPAADPRAGGLLDQILATIKQTTSPNQLSALAQAYKGVADRLPAADPRAGGLLDQILAAIKQAKDTDQLKALAQAYKAVADKLPAADPRAGGLLDQLLAVSKQTTSPYQLSALAQAYRSVADKLPAADPRAGGLLDQILAAIKQAKDTDQLNALAQAYKAVADKLPAADPRAVGLLDQLLAAIKQTTDTDQLNALAQAYKTVADKLPAADLRRYSSALRDARYLARDNEPWLNIAQAELLVLPKLSIEDAKRLTSDLMRDPLCVGKNRATVLAAFAARLDAEADLEIRPNKPWGDDVWAFVAWAKTKGGFNPDRISPRFCQ